jgi:hypothetical protein
VDRGSEAKVGMEHRIADGISVPSIDTLQLREQGVRQCQRECVRIMQYPTAIESPIDKVSIDESKRPFWSVMIPTCNRTDYLKETILSVLSQAPDRGCRQCLT